MSFTIDPKSGPSVLNPGQAQASQPMSARDRAIAKLTTPNAQANPVADPSKVAPEDLSAITPTSNRQPDTSEAPPAKAASEATEQKEEPLTTQYAVLARKEKALRAKVQEFRAQEQALKAREEALKAKETPQSQAIDPSKFIDKTRLQEDPLGVLSELGYTFDDLTAKALNQPSPESQAQAQYLKKLEAKIAQLEETQNNTKKSLEDNQQQQYKQAITQIRNETKQLVLNDPSFETIKETGSIDDVVELIEKTFNADGVLLTVEEAAQAVEEHLVEEALKIAKLKKIQQKLQASAPKPAAPAQKQQSPQQQQAKTLTNALATQKPLTARERALLAFEGKLK